MPVETLIGLVSAIIGTGGLVGSLLLLPKIRAEARKFNAEASHTEWRTLRLEIGRLQARTAAQEARIAELEHGAQERIAELGRERSENRRLRGEVRRLTRRVEGLETIMNLHPIPPEMKAAIAELDRKTRGRK